MSKYKTTSLFLSLKFAIKGLSLAIASQRNFRIDVILGVLVLIGAVLAEFSNIEFAVLVLTIGLVLFAELINTSIEFIIDAYFGNKFSVIAKMTKDISAGAVLLSVFIAIVVGFLLFLPKAGFLLNKFFNFQ